MGLWCVYSICCEKCSLFNASYQSDWEASSEEEEDEKPAAPAAPPKKKGTLKQKLAEKEALKAQKAADDEDYDEDAVLDPREKARRDKERELASDLNNAADLFGAAALGGASPTSFLCILGALSDVGRSGTSSKELDWLVSAQPRTKEDFVEFSDNIIEYIIKRHQGKPLYAAFLEHHVRELAMPLRDVEVRKVASGLTALSNEKQKEQREKASGKKKPKVVGKPTLGATKPSSKYVIPFTDVPSRDLLTSYSAHQDRHICLRGGSGRLWARRFHVEYVSMGAPPVPYP